MGQAKAVAKISRADTTLNAARYVCVCCNSTFINHQYNIFHTVNGMKLERVKQWLQFNIVVPGLALAVGNNTT